MFVGTKTVIEDLQVGKILSVTVKENVPPVFTVIEGVLVALIIPTPVQLYVTLEVVVEDA